MRIAIIIRECLLENHCCKLFKRDLNLRHRPQRLGLAAEGYLEFSKCSQAERRHNAILWDNLISNAARPHGALPTGRQAWQRADGE